MESIQRKKLSKSEGYSLIEEYFSSGELPSVFYRRVGLSECQFYKWRRRYLNAHPQVAKRLGIALVDNVGIERSTNRKSITKTSSTTHSFARVEVSGSVPIAASAVTATSSHSFTYELCYPNGVVLRLPISISTSSLLCYSRFLDRFRF